MGAVHGVSLKYALVAGFGAWGLRSQLAECDSRGEITWLQMCSLFALSHVVLVNSCVFLCFHLRLGMRMLGKDPEKGRIPLWSYVCFAGFHAPTWLYTRIQMIKDRHSRLAAATEVAPGWWVGGRYAAELGRHWTAVVDLTCEFPEGCADSMSQYLLCPCWDGVPPTPYMLEQAADFATAAHELGGDILVHCAHGRGRSTTVMCACLVKLGLHATWEEAFEAVRKKRRVVKLNKSMRSALAAWQEQYMPPDPSRPYDNCEAMMDGKVHPDDIVDSKPSRGGRGSKSFFRWPFGNLIKQRIV
eukprot:TRINITY_DN111681_c0_g1_i1.p1 TRINITY_DN111681_c0_g1~~TRINITY_DN111681_c0_g1_i1.p1  ORF type:complete len:315 (+),score=65.66 TRINITY_DN111681_c0_g1_i1:45-947(+)